MTFLTASGCRSLLAPGVISMTLGLLAPAALAHEKVQHADHHQAAPVKEQKDWGIAGDASAARRTVTISMDDRMRFSPAKLSFRQGETVKLVVSNRGKLLHELVIGTPQELAAHADLMAQHPGMEHDEPYMAHVAPGKSGSLVWTFNRPGDFEFACLVNGHFQAGMKGQIRVSPAP